MGEALIVDVSSFQPVRLDYSKIKAAGVIGAMVKATDGLNSPDKFFLDHVKGFTDVGIPCGGYHYLLVRKKPTLQDAEQQADQFVDRYLSASCTLLPACDNEDQENTGCTVDEWLEAIRTFRDRVKARLGALMQYSYPYFWGHDLGKQVANATDLGIDPLWWAEYATFLTPPKPWTKATLWQFTDKGDVDGIPGKVDLSRLAPGMTLADLTRMSSAVSVPSEGHNSSDFTDDETEPDPTANDPLV